jgi:hypothetical protein
LVSTNAIELSYVNTKSIVDEPIYSDDGTEYLYTRRFVHVEAVVSSSLLPALAGESSTQTMARIKHLLEQPRKQLWFFVGRDLLFQSPGPQPLPGAVDSNGNPLPPVIADAKWGPFPRHCTINRIGGTESYNIDYAIETFVQECPGQSPENPPPAYLSHRWRESISIDEKAYSRRTRTGKIVTRSDFYTNPDAIRGVVTPRLLPGFRRVTSEYVLQEDGLAMQYTFVDQEVYLMPPAPAFKAEGEYIESVQEGAIRFGECRVRLEGSKTDFLGGKARLLQLALLIVRNKLELAGVMKTGQYLFLKDGAIREDMYDNIVEVRYRGMMQPLKAKTQGAAVDLRRFGGEKPYGSGTDAPPDPGERGTALLEMFANVLNDPCAQQAILRNTSSTTLTAVGTQVLPTFPVIWTTTVLPDSQSVLRATDYGGVYTSYKIHAHHAESPHTHQLAVAQPGANAAFVQLAATTSGRVEEWTAERAGQWPKMPPVNTSDPNLVYLGLEITNREVEPQADGSTPRYIISGRYRYGHVDYTQASLDAPVPPYVDSQFRAQFSRMPPEAFENGITNPTGPETNVLHAVPLGGNLPTATLTADDTVVVAGISTTLRWATTNAVSVTLFDGASWNPVSASGSTTVGPFQTTGYLLFAFGANGGVAQAQQTVVVLTQ